MSIHIWPKDSGHHLVPPTSSHTYESIPFRYIAGGLHPDHDTIAHFRKTFLPEIATLFAQVLLVAREAGVLELGNISLDGSKVHADLPVRRTQTGRTQTGASKSKAVSYGRLLELEEQLQAEVEELLALGEKADQGALPEGLDIAHEVTLRQDKLANLTHAKAVLEARAQERYEAEQAEYEAKLRERPSIRHPANRQGRMPRPGADVHSPREQHRRRRKVAREEEDWAGSSGYAGANEEFGNVQVVLYMSGSWQVGQFTDQIGDAFDWEAVPNPCGPGACTAMPGGAALVAIKDTEHPEEPSSCHRVTGSHTPAVPSAGMTSKPPM